MHSLLPKCSYWESRYQHKKLINASTCMCNLLSHFIIDVYFKCKRRCSTGRRDASGSGMGFDYCIKLAGCGTEYEKGTIIGEGKWYVG